MTARLTRRDLETINDALALFETYCQDEEPPEEDRASWRRWRTDQEHLEVVRVKVLHRLRDGFPTAPEPGSVLDGPSA